MKVIDLLNKIANGEDVPNKIKIGGDILKLNEEKDNYYYGDSDEYYGDELIHWFKLNDEVKIYGEYNNNFDKLEDIKTEIEWIISTSTEEMTIARCNIILSIIEKEI